MGLKPTTGEKIAYFLLVIFLIVAILLGTYIYLHRRNKRLKSQRSPTSIGLLGQSNSPNMNHFEPPPVPTLHTYNPQIHHFHQRSISRDDSITSFTAHWAREQALAAAAVTHTSPRPLTIYPESSISCAGENAPTRGRQSHTTRPRSPIRNISPLQRRIQNLARDDHPPREDSLPTDKPYYRPNESPNRPSYISLTPSSSPVLNPRRTPEIGPAPASPPPKIYTLHLNRRPTEHIQHAPSHYSEASPNLPPSHPNHADTFSNPHRHASPPSYAQPPRHPSAYAPPTTSAYAPPSSSTYPSNSSAYPPSSSHHSPHNPTITAPSPTPSSPDPDSTTPTSDTARTDIAACVNPSYLSTALSRHQGRRARWSAYGLGSEAGSDSEDGVVVVRGRVRGEGGSPRSVRSSRTIQNPATGKISGRMHDRTPTPSPHISARSARSEASREIGWEDGLAMIQQTSPSTIQDISPRTGFPSPAAPTPLFGRGGGARVRLGGMF